METGWLNVSNPAELAMWVLIGISVPSIANPWQNLALRLVGVLVGTIILILWVFYT